MDLGAGVRVVAVRWMDLANTVTTALIAAHTTRCTTRQTPCCAHYALSTRASNSTITQWSGGWQVELRYAVVVVVAVDDMGPSAATNPTTALPVCTAQSVGCHVTSTATSTVVRPNRLSAATWLDVLGSACTAVSSAAKVVVRPRLTWWQ